jgi:hypothetical protein
MSADKHIGCDVCGELKPIVWHGIAYGTETSACSDCAYGVQERCPNCERVYEDCRCEPDA